MENPGDGGQRVIRRLALLPALLCVFACALLWDARPACAEEEVSVRVGLETEDALLGDTVAFHIVVDGVDTATGPELDAFGFDFDVRFLGGRPERSSSTLIANGRSRTTDILRYTLMYTLRPRRAGPLQIPALTVRADEREFTTPPRKMRVVGPRASRRASLRLSFAPRRVYVEQPVDFVLEIALQRAQLPDEWFAGDPWFQGRPPELRVPWFQELDGFLAGDPQSFMRNLLAPGHESGMRINGIGSQSLLGRTRALRFALRRRSELRDGRAYHIYTLRKTLTPLSAGQHEIPVSSLTGDLLLTLERKRGQLQAGEPETLFIAHDAVSLNVLPIPESGRPPTYVHAVGRYHVRAEVRPKRVKVGDPMNVTLVVEGLGLLDRIATPALELQPRLADDFQVSEADPPRTTDSARTFTYLFRPRHAGVTEVPPLDFVAFDPEAERFVTVRTDALEISVEDALAVLPSDLVIASGAMAAESSPGEEVQGGVLGNYASDDTIVDEAFEPEKTPLFWLLLVAPPLAFAGVLMTARRRAAREADPLRQRARTALPRALDGVRAAAQAFDEGDAHAAAGRLHGALSGYVADRARRPSGGMTAADVGQILSAARVSGDVSGGLVDALRAAEASRFGGAAGDLSAQLAAAPEWLRALEREQL